MDINQLPTEVLDGIFQLVDWNASLFVCKLWHAIIIELIKRSPNWKKANRRNYLCGFQGPVSLVKIKWIVDTLKYPIEYAAQYAVRSGRKNALKWAIAQEMKCKENGEKEEKKGEKEGENAEKEGENAEKEGKRTKRRVPI